MPAEINGGMNRGIYAVATGMLASQQQMDVVSNNLANVNTAGYKQDKLLFNDALVRSMSNAAGAQIGSLGAGGTIKEQTTDFSQGAIKESSSPTDLAIQGKGMFAVQDASGRVAYTRNGSFTTRADGTLVNQADQTVLDPSLKPIVLRQGALHISADGSISSGQDSAAYAKIGIFDGGFSKLDDGHFASPSATALSGTDQTAHIKQGAIETSNVSAISSMVNMIELGRTYEMSQKSIQSEDDMTERLTSVLS